MKTKIENEMNRERLRFKTIFHRIKIQRRKIKNEEYFTNSQKLTSHENKKKAKQFRSKSQLVIYVTSENEQKQKKTKQIINYLYEWRKVENT